MKIDENPMKYEEKLIRLAKPYQKSSGNLCESGRFLSLGFLFLENPGRGGSRDPGREAPGGESHVILGAKGREGAPLPAPPWLPPRSF